MLLKTKEIQQYKLKRANMENIRIQIITVVPFFIALSIMIIWYLDHLVELNLIDIAFTAAVLGILIVASYIDKKHQEIPYMASIFSLVCVAAKVVFCRIQHTAPTLPMFHIGMTSGIFLLLVILCILGQLGGGDIQIMLPIFILFGNNIFNILIFLMALSIVGLITALPSIIREKTLKVSIPMAPSITGAFFVTALISNVTSTLI